MSVFSLGRTGLLVYAAQEQQVQSTVKMNGIFFDVDNLSLNKKNACTVEAQ